MERRSRLIPAGVQPEGLPHCTGTVTAHGLAAWLAAPVTQGQLTADSPEGTSCLLKMSSSFRSFVEHAFFSSSLTFQIRSFWACVRQPAADRLALFRERSPTRGRVHPGPFGSHHSPASQPCSERSCRIPRTLLPARGIVSESAWGLGTGVPGTSPSETNPRTHKQEGTGFICPNTQHRREEGRLPNYPRASRDKPQTPRPPQSCIMLTTVNGLQVFCKQNCKSLW